MIKMIHYIYSGPVLNKYQVLTNEWIGETYAISDKKAKSNLAYQFKKQHGLLPSAKVILPKNPIKG
jgi:hypothetical protein